MTTPRNQPPAPSAGAPPVHPSAHTGARSGIELHGLTKTFTTGGRTIRAVRGIDLSISPGETVALLGPNGAGKSTTIDMMLGLLQSDSGSASVFGMSPQDAVRAGAVGAMLQTGGVIRFLKVRELVQLMASFYPHPLDVDEVMTMTGIAEIAGQKTDKLSGGQAQRVRAALALVSNSDLLVLDEPTVAMDVEGRHQFWEFMRRIASSGKTVIFATHYLEEADAFADRIVLMSRGRIVADGSTTEIKSTVGQRTIRATLPGADTTQLSTLAGVSAAEMHGETLILRCTDSDAAIRALLPACPQVRDIEISGAGLEEAFLALTGDTAEDTTNDMTTNEMENAR